MIHSKLYWREFVKEIKRTLTQEELRDKSELICNKLLQHPRFLDANCVVSYWPLPREASLIALNKHAINSKTLLLPTIVDNDLALKAFCGADKMVFGKYNINEPQGEDWKEIEKIDLILVPGIAYDKQNNRLGRGKGFYDRFLNSMKAHKIGICFDFQLVEELPTETHDQKVNEVITD